MRLSECRIGEIAKLLPRVKQWSCLRRQCFYVGFFVPRPDAGCILTQLSAEINEEDSAELRDRRKRAACDLENVVSRLWVDDPFERPSFRDAVKECSAIRTLWGFELSSSVPK